MTKDIIRQSLNLILPPLMWVCSSLGFMIEGARSPSDMSDANDSLLVPFGAAFSIWLPIFALCITYGVLQALPKNRTHQVYRQIGGWSAAGFAGVCVWGLINAFAPMAPFDWAQWGTAIIFVPTTLLLVKSMLVATAEKPNMSKLERYTAHMGLSLIAGWCSLAVFLNWTPQVVAALSGAGVPIWASNIVMLIPALVWAVFITRKSGLNRAYAFPIIWGLAFLILARLIETPQNYIIAFAAIIGVFIILAAIIVRPNGERA